MDQTLSDITGPDLWAPSDAGMLVKRFCYLKSPERIRTAILNETGRAPPVERIEKILTTLPETGPSVVVGEPLDTDGLDFAPRGESYRVLSIKHTLNSDFKGGETPRRRRAMAVSAEVREAIARAAAKIKDKRSCGGSSNKPENALEHPAKALIRRTSALLNIDEPTILGGSRFREHVEARALICVLLRRRDITKYSFSALGRIFNGKEHTSIRYLVQNWDIYTKRNPKLLEHAETLWEGMDRA